MKNEKVLQNKTAFDEVDMQSFAMKTPFECAELGMLRASNLENGKKRKY